MAGRKDAREAPKLIAWLRLMAKRESFQGSVVGALASWTAPVLALSYVPLPPPKRQRTGAVQNLAELRALSEQKLPLKSQKLYLPEPLLGHPFGMGDT